MNHSKRVTLLLTVPILLGLGTVIALRGCGPIGRNDLPDGTATALSQQGKTEVEQMMYRWLEGGPCKPPCWEGITPGQTTITEALTILERHSLVTNLETVIPARSDTGATYWDWKRVNGGGGFVGFYVGQTVYEVCVADPFHFLTFHDVIEAYGEPSHVYAWAGPSTDGRDTVYWLEIVYVPQGFVLHWSKTHRAGEEVKPEFGPQWRDFGLCFFEPTKEGFALSWGNLGVADSLIPWRGMLGFDDYCQGSRCGSR